jgi:RNA polymerase sigma factor (sigma-70 family)
VSQTESDAAARSSRFQQLALPHLDAAYNLARWLSGNANDADDIVQDAFMRAFRFFDQFHGDSARPWLLTIVRRTWYSEWRRRATSRNTVEFDDNLDDATFDDWSDGSAADPEMLLIREEDTRLVHEALEKLPVEYREVMILRELEEMSYREIAEIADLPLGTVMSRLARGRRKLAALLGQSQAGAQPQRSGARSKGGGDGERARSAAAGTGAAAAPGAAAAGAVRPASGADARPDTARDMGSGEGPRARLDAPPGAAATGAALRSPAVGTWPEAGPWTVRCVGSTPGDIAQETPDGL